MIGQHRVLPATIYFILFFKKTIPQNVQARRGRGVVGRLQCRGDEGNCEGWGSYDEAGRIVGDSRRRMAQGEEDG
jgi:hypothetical protein